MISIINSLNPFSSYEAWKNLDNMVEEKERKNERKKTYEHALKEQILVKKEKDLEEKFIEKENDGNLIQMQKEIIKEQESEKRLNIHNSKKRFNKENEELMKIKNKKKEV